MKFQGTKKMAGSTSAQQKYLKFWGKHYPYLNGNNGNEQRWLPIPENSEAQRFIRSMSRTFQPK
jgi:hypothetical protein